MRLTPTPRRRPPVPRQSRPRCTCARTPARRPPRPPERMRTYTAAAFPGSTSGADSGHDISNDDDGSDGERLCAGCLSFSSRGPTPPPPSSVSRTAAARGFSASGIGRSGDSGACNPGLTRPFNPFGNCSAKPWKSGRSASSPQRSKPVESGSCFEQPTRRQARTTTGQPRVMASREVLSRGGRSERVVATSWVASRLSGPSPWRWKGDTSSVARPPSRAGPLEAQPTA